MIRTDFTAGEALPHVDLNEAFGSLKCNVAGTALWQVDEVPVYAGTPGQYRTAFPYVPGTLKVSYGGPYCVKYVDAGTASQFNETSNPTPAAPTLFVFTAAPMSTTVDAKPPIGTDPTGSQQIRATYVRADL